VVGANGRASFFSRSQGRRRRTPWNRRRCGLAYSQDGGTGGPLAVVGSAAPGGGRCKSSPLVLPDVSEGARVSPPIKVSAAILVTAGNAYGLCLSRWCGFRQRVLRTGGSRGLNGAAQVIKSITALRLPAGSIGAADTHLDGEWKCWPIWERCAALLDLPAP